VETIDEYAHLGIIHLTDDFEKHLRTTLKQKE